MNENPNASGQAAESAGNAHADAAALANELAAQKDRYLRLAADFDNYRKRTAQENDRRAAAQKEAVLQELLPVINNLERALSSNASADQLREGVQMTLQQLQQLLRSHGIEAEESLGQPFDPNRHEALRTGHDPTKPPGIVLEVFERGYRRANDVFRPARVVVNEQGQPEEPGHGG